MVAVSTEHIPSKMFSDLQKKKKALLWHTNVSHDTLIFFLVNVKHMVASWLLPYSPELASSLSWCISLRHFEALVGDCWIKRYLLLQYFENKVKLHFHLLCRSFWLHRFVPLKLFLKPSSRFQLNLHSLMSQSPIHALCYWNINVGIL